jgi:Protein of unknown function (DUF642)
MDRHLARLFRQWLRPNSTEGFGMKGLARALLAATIALVASQASAQNLIGNGGFEQPVVPVGSATAFTNGQTFPKWTIVGAKGNVSVSSGQQVIGGIHYLAKAGQQWIDLTGSLDGGAPIGVQQIVTTTIGQAYTLTFSIGTVYYVGGASTIVHALVDGVTAMTATTFQDGGTDQVWKTFSFTFTAAKEKTAVAFINGDPLGDGVAGLDAVSLVAVTP